MTANERDPRVAVVHGCHSEGGDSILSAFRPVARGVRGVRSNPPFDLSQPIIYTRYMHANCDRRYVHVYIRVLPSFANS